MLLQEVPYLSRPIRKEVLPHCTYRRLHSQYLKISSKKTNGDIYKNNRALFRRKGFFFVTKIEDGSYFDKKRGEYEQNYLHQSAQIYKSHSQTFRKKGEKIRLTAKF